MRGATCNGLAFHQEGNYIGIVALFNSASFHSASHDKLFVIAIDIQPLRVPVSLPQQLSLPAGILRYDFFLSH